MWWRVERAKETNIGFVAWIERDVFRESELGYGGIRDGLVCWWYLWKRRVPVE